MLPQLVEPRLLEKWQLVLIEEEKKDKEQNHQKVWLELLKERKLLQKAGKQGLCVQEKDTV